MSHAPLAVGDPVRTDTCSPGLTPPPHPRRMATLARATEAIAGLLLALGLLTPVAGAMIVGATITLGILTAGAALAMRQPAEAGTLADDDAHEEARAA